MTVYYTTAAKVASLLQCSSFSDSTTPTQAEVEAWINWAEDEIDRRTHHAWRLTTVTHEYHDFRAWPHVQWGRTVGDPRVKLDHRAIRNPLVDGTDELAIWLGDEYADLLDSSEYTEGRDEDWWLDYEHGVLYLRTVWPHERNNAFRLTYRYGTVDASYNPDPPADIEEAATMLAALQLLTNNRKTMQLPEGGDAISFRETYELWTRRVDAILRRHTEWRTI